MGYANVLPSLAVGVTGTFGFLACWGIANGDWALAAVFGFVTVFGILAVISMCKSRKAGNRN